MKPSTYTSGKPFRRSDIHLAGHRTMLIHLIRPRGLASLAHAHRVRSAAKAAAIALALSLLSNARPIPALGAGFAMFSTVPYGTGEKPQSKLWYHDGFYWCIVQGPNGVAFYQLVNGTWQRGAFANAVLQPSGNADVKWNGTNLFVCVFSPGGPNLFKYTYAPATRAWELVTGFPVALPNPGSSGTDAAGNDV